VPGGPSRRDREAVNTFLSAPFFNIDTPDYKVTKELIPQWHPATRSTQSAVPISYPGLIPTISPAPCAPYLAILRTSLGRWLAMNIAPSVDPYRSLIVAIDRRSDDQTRRAAAKPTFVRPWLARR
jgi:hypothetical protein